MSNEKQCKKCYQGCMAVRDRSKVEQLISILDSDWLCKPHALEFVKEKESQLINSTNRSTSITEQRMLDEIQVMKLRLKGS